MKEIYFAAGCFWGVQEYFRRLDGVVDTLAGYANGNIENPSYEDVATGTTNFVEVVKIVYDNSIIGREDLLLKFWRIIDPTLLNRQGPDIGSQYRTGIYYLDDEDLGPIRASLEEEQKKYSRKIVTELARLESFYRAEDYHQFYLKKHPHRYCHIDLDA